jgi:hypothetical protein
MAMGVEPQKISKRLEGDDRSGHPIPLWNRLLDKHPQGLPSTTTQFRKERTIIKKITPEDLGDAEDKMTMGNLFQNLSAHPFAKLNHSLLVAGGTEVSALAREGQKIFMAALCTSDSGKAVAQNATVQIAVDHGPQIGTVKPIGPLKALFIDLFKVLEMILNTLVIGRILRPARTVGAVFRSVFSFLRDTMRYRDRGRLGLVVHRLS